MRPKLILADEPVSMLDVSIRIGLLNLMAKLRDEEGVSILYITHDIASARYVADRLIVMYAGQIAETGPIEDVLARPQAPVHPAAAVRGARPARAAVGGGGDRPRRAAAGHRPDPRLPVPLALPAGHRRRARQVTPELAELRPGHDAACHVAQTSHRGSEGVHHEACGDRRRIHLHARARRRDRPAAAVRSTELVLVDPDPDRLAVVGPVSARIMAAHDHPGRVTLDQQTWTRAPRARTRSCSSSGSAARPPASVTRPGRWTAAASARRPPGPAGWPRRCGPCRSCSI